MKGCFLDRLQRSLKFWTRLEIVARDKRSNLFGFRSNCKKNSKNKWIKCLSLRSFNCKLVKNFLLAKLTTFKDFTCECVTHVNATHMWMRHTCECVTHVNISRVWMHHICDCISRVKASHMWKHHTCKSITHVKGSQMWRRHTCESVHMWRDNTYEVFTWECVSHESLKHMKESNVNMSNMNVSYIRFSHIKASHVILSHIKASHVVLSHKYGVTWRRCDTKKASHEECHHMMMESHEVGVTRRWRHIKMASHEEWRHTKKASRLYNFVSASLAQLGFVMPLRSISQPPWVSDSDENNHLKNILKNQQHVPKCSKLACLSDLDTIFWAKVGPTWVACMLQILGKTVNVG